MKSSRWSLWFALIPIMVLAVLAVIFDMLKIPADIGPPILIPILNTFFISLISLLGILISTRSFSIFGSWPNLILGGGLLSFALAHLASGWLTGPLGEDTGMTAHNAESLLSSILFLLGAILSLRAARPCKEAGRVSAIIIFYGAILVSQALFVVLSFWGIIPPFFVSGAGLTIPGQAVIVASAGLFFLAALLYCIFNIKVKSDFLYWYILGLVLVGTALVTLLFETAIGDLFAWLARSCLYLGSVYFLIGLLAAWREARATGRNIIYAVTQLRDPVASYRLISETSRDAVFSTDIEGKILLWNAAAGRLFGYSANEALGLVHTDLFKPEHTGYFRRELYTLANATGQNVILKAAEDEEIEDEIWAKKKDGTTFPSVLSISARKTKLGWIITFFVRDITKRKKAEEALRESEQKYRSLFSSMSEGFGLCEIILDANGKPSDYLFIELNDAFVRLTGLSVESAIGKTARQVLPGIEPYWIETFGRVALTRESVHFENFSAKLGKWYGVYAYSPRKNQFAVLFGDITERRQAEEELQKTRDHLAELVKERTEELSKANQELQLEIADRMRTAAELRAFAQLKELHRQNSIMSEMREMLQACSTIQEMTPIFTSSITKLFPNTAGALFLMHNSRIDLESVARWGDFPEEVDDNIFAPNACWGLRRGRFHVVEDIKTGSVCPHLKHSPSAPYMCLPLIAKGEILGLLHLMIKPSTQGEDNRNAIAELKESAVTLAEYLSISIANIKLWEKLAEQSIRDPLTGLFNRRYMEETINREILRATRKQTKIGIIMADIDHLKNFNDSYGHDAGDELLIKLADLLKAKIRGSDIACRYGGEEFMLILPESPTENTYKRAEYIREEVKNLKVYFHDQLLPSITLSIGTATYPDHGTELNELIRIADVALYKAKEQGRDRVVSGLFARS